MPVQSTKKKKGNPPAPSDMSTSPDSFCDNVLEIVFSQLPLFDLMVHIPHVKKRWARIQRHILGDLSSIVIRFGANSNNLYTFNKFRIPHGNNLIDADTGRVLYPDQNDLNMLYYKTMKRTTMDTMITLMPQMTVLELCISKESIDNVTVIVKYLRHWADSLEFLKIYAQFEESTTTTTTITAIEGDTPDKKEEESKIVKEPIPLNIAPLIDAINSLSVINHLTLYLENVLDLTVLNFSFLSRLDEFYFYSLNDNLSPLFTALKMHAEPNGDNLRKIAIGNAGCWTDYLEHFADTPQLASRFVDLPQVHEFADGSNRNIDADARCFIERFPRLRKFKQWLKVRKLDWLARTLAPLVSLDFLRLLLYSKSALSRSEMLTTDQIPALPSVKQLSIAAWPSSHVELSSRHWAHLFPSVQCIVLMISCLKGARQFCSACGLPFNVSLERVQPCIKKMIATFRHMPELKYIFVYVNNNTKNCIEITVLRDGDKVEFIGV